MKARIEGGKIIKYNQVPETFEGNDKHYLNFRDTTDAEKESAGFYDVVVPTYDGRTQELGDIYFDSDNSQFTYPVNNKTWDDSLADLKAAKIKQLKGIYNTKLSKTDWYVTRKSEKSIAIPSDIQTERDDLRADCETHEASINAKTTKAQVESYDLPSIT
jgi:hypothetical protein